MHTFLMWLGIVAIIGAVLPFLYVGIKVLATGLFNDGHDAERYGFGLVMIIDGLIIGCALLLLLLGGE